MWYHLLIDNNRIGDDGVAKIFKALEGNNTITELYLGK